jgi:hypothetical protein
MFQLEEHWSQRAFDGGLPAAITARPVVMSIVGRR